MSACTGIVVFSEERKKRRVAAEKKAQQELEKRKQEYSNRAAVYEKKNADGEAVIKRVSESVPSDFSVESIHLKSIYDSGILNVFYAK